MRRPLPTSAHTEQPWLIHQIAPDFALEDVWRVRTPGAGAGDLDLVLDIIWSRAASDGERPQGDGAIARALFRVRWWLGELLGWDRPEDGLGARVSPVGERVPELAAAAQLKDHAPGPFTAIYRRPNEQASEMANKTVHAIMHLGWVATGSGDYELRIAALTRPNGRRGHRYMRAIAPFRRFLVWPPMIGAWERSWRDREPVTGGVIPPRHLQPDTAAALSVRPDYLDRFELTTSARATATPWLEHAFSDVSAASRELIFRQALGMRLAPGGTPNTLLGLRIVSADDQRVVLEGRGPRVATNLLMEQTDAGVALTTALEYRSRTGRRVWRLMSRVHRRLAPGVLRTGSARLRANAHRHDATARPEVPR